MVQNRPVDTVVVWVLRYWPPPLKNRGEYNFDSGTYNTEQSHFQLSTAAYILKQLWKIQQSCCQQFFLIYTLLEK